MKKAMHTELAILGASLGVDFEADTLVEVAAKLAQKKIGVLRLHLDDALVCFAVAEVFRSELNSALDAAQARLEINHGYKE